MSDSHICLLSTEKDTNNLNRAYYKKKITSNETKQKMRELLSLEYEFYNFVKKRLYTLINFIECQSAYDNASQISDETGLRQMGEFA